MGMNRTDRVLKLKYWRQRNTDWGNFSVYVKMPICMSMCTYMFHPFLEIFKLKDPVCCRLWTGACHMLLAIEQYCKSPLLSMYSWDYTEQTLLCKLVLQSPLCFLCRFWMGNSEYEPNHPVNTAIDSSGLWSTSLVTPSYLFRAISPFSLLLSYFDAMQKILGKPTKAKLTIFSNLNISYWLLMLMYSISF